MSVVDQNLAGAFLTLFDTPDQLRNWCLTYLDVDFPSGHVDPDSNSSPVEWMFEAYANYRSNNGAAVPGYIVLSSRESYKTWSESAFAVIMMCHFGCTIAHMAAIERQASQAITYISSFIGKVKPFLVANNRKLVMQNQTKVEIEDNKTGHLSHVEVIIATLQGSNSPHKNILSVDEVDVMRYPTAYEEAKLIPGVFGGQFPLTIRTSTRKFAFGLMEKEIQNSAESGEKLLRWNVIDVTEYCQPFRHLPEQPKQMRYVHKDLPLRNISPKEFEGIPEQQRIGWTGINAHAGCATCKLLPVCKMRLSERSPEDRGGLYKPIDFVINQFRKISPDMGEAQLMCWRPSAAGIIYKRFDETEITGNVYSLQQAWAVYTGTPPPLDLTIEDLMRFVVDRGLRFRVGIDWGFRHYYAVVVTVEMPNGELWVTDCHAVAELELEDKLKYALLVDGICGKPKFYPDNSDPASIKTFRRNKLMCISFKKDVSAGIEAVRSQIMDGTGRRRLKVIRHARTEAVVQMFRNHHFKLDPAGNPTQEPDDEEFADIGDALRYIGQNLVSRRGAVVAGTSPEQPAQVQNKHASPYQSWMSTKIRELAVAPGIGRIKNRTGSIIADFGGDEPIDGES